MCELGLFEKNNEVWISSRDVAEKFEKRHDHVLRDIDNLIPQNWGVRNMAKENTYINERGREYREYLLNRDGFSLVAMGFTGEKALQWKLDYINAFNKMETFIKQRESSEWQLARQQGKLIRRKETDAIQMLIPYAMEQGSKNADKLYINYSNLVNKTIGLKSGQRPLVDWLSLVHIGHLEDCFTQTIIDGIKNGVYYKEIYKRCKEKAELYKLLIPLKPTFAKTIEEAEECPND